MTGIKLPHRQIALILSLSLAILTSDFHSVRSQSDSNNNGEETELRFVPPPPPRRGAPVGRRRGGASRSPCQKYESLTALVPVTDEFVGGLTTAERPTFWFFVPETSATEVPAEFVLQDRGNNYIYKTTLTIPKTEGGAIAISLPPTVAPLEPDESYYWTFSVSCAPDKNSAYVYVQGAIERVSLPTLQNQLEVAAPLERVALYANRGIWYEALGELAQLRRANPNERKFTDAWTDLLQQVDLDAIAPQPILDCCRTESARE